MTGHDEWDGVDLTALARDIKQWARELGFQGLGISDCDLSAAEPGLLAWLEQGCHGDMDYMARHGTARSRPAELLPGTLTTRNPARDFRTHGLYARRYLANH
jgi:epoxyqueuosine reductase